MKSEVLNEEIDFQSTPSGHDGFDNAAEEWISTDMEEEICSQRSTIVWVAWFFKAVQKRALACVLNLNVFGVEQ